MVVDDTEPIDELVNLGYDIIELYPDTDENGYTSWEIERTSLEKFIRMIIDER